MHRLIFMLCLLLSGTFLVQAAHADDDKAAPVRKEIQNKKFEVFPIGSDKRLGEYNIRAYTNEAKQQIEIVELLSLTIHGKAVVLKSTVFCENKPPFAPQAGTAETGVRGVKVMQGTVTLAEKTFDTAGKVFVDKKRGAVLNPPEVFKRSAQPLAEGVRMFQSVLPVIGPRLLPNAGKLEKVLFVEFPDDIDNLVNFKADYLLERSKPNAKGEYTMQLFSPNSGRVSFVLFNKADQIQELELYGKFKLVEVVRKKK